MSSESCAGYLFYWNIMMLTITNVQLRADPVPTISIRAFYSIIKELLTPLYLFLNAQISICEEFVFMGWEDHSVLSSFPFHNNHGIHI